MTDMEQANHRTHSYSKKRKEPCALENPSTAIFTRSRSQIYLHRSRSGRLRPDPSRHGTQYPDIFCLLTLNKKPRTASWSSDEDLRTSGVFSADEENQDVKVFEDEIEGFRDEVSPSMVDLQPKIPNSTFFDKDGSIGKVSDDSRATGDTGEVEAERQENTEDGSLATTPPDAEIIRNKLVYESQNTEQVHQSNTQNDVQVEDGLYGADDKPSRFDKSVLTPRFRGKLFKTPGSFSYRRLLPYLMDSSKDKSSFQKIGQWVRFDTALEQKLFQSVSAAHSQGIKGKLDTENSPGESCADDLRSNESKSISLADPTGFSIPNGSTNDLSRRGNISDIAGMEKTNAGVPCEIPNSDNSSIGSPVALKSTNLDRCDKNSAKPDDTEHMEYQKAEPYDNYFACKTQNLDCHDSSQSSKGEYVRDYYDDPKQFGGSRVTKKHKVNHDCGAQNRCHQVSIAQRDEKMRVDRDGDGNTLDQIGYPNKEISMTVPPNDGVSLQSESDDCVFGSPSTRIVHWKNGSVEDSRISSTSKCKMMEMLEVRSSFNQRRLLPFLMNIIDDESGACKDDTKKIEKISEQKPLPKLSSSNSDEIAIERSTCASFLQMPSTNFQPALLFPGQDMNSSSTIESQRPPKLQAEVKKMETLSDNANVTHGCGIPSIKRCSFSSKESIAKEASSLVLNQSSLSSEIGCMECITKYTSGGKRVEFGSIAQKFSQIEAPVPLGVPSFAFKKGILKRNPRGCRGVCTCLNCAAFRLNAKKAFEFSRNQMQDAEEVTLDLIRELTYLRNMLEKSAFYHRVASDNQVKEACRNASKAEQLAMNRLRLMNYELNIHCRIPCEERPRVRFANQVEEKSFARSDSEQ